jgi:leucyl aminopeptidase
VYYKFFILLFFHIDAPELLFDQAELFKSEIADMKNSVNDRFNAQAAAAGNFIEQHLVGDKWDWRKQHNVGQKGLWAHLDIAGCALLRKKRLVQLGLV